MHIILLTIVYQWCRLKFPLEFLILELFRYKGSGVVAGFFLGGWRGQLFFVLLRDCKSVLFSAPPFVKSCISNQENPNQRALFWPKHNQLFGQRRRVVWFLACALKILDKKKFLKTFGFTPPKTKGMMKSATFLNVDSIDLSKSEAVDFKGLKSVASKAFSWSWAVV